MFPDISKSTKAVNEFLRAIGLSVGPRFAPIATSAAITFTVAGGGLYLLDEAKSDLDELAQRIVSVEKEQKANSDFVQSVAKKINDTADGFWIPVSMDLESPSASVSLKLPIQGQDRVEMAIYYEDSNAERALILSQNLLVAINGEVLSPSGQYMDTDVPILVEKKYIREEKAYQQIKISLANTLGQDQFEKLRGRQVGLLIVVKRAVLAPRKQEDVPEIGSAT